MLRGGAQQHAPASFNGVWDARIFLKVAPHLACTMDRDRVGHLLGLAKGALESGAHLLSLVVSADYCTLSTTLLEPPEARKVKETQRVVR